MKQVELLFLKLTAGAVLLTALNLCINAQFGESSGIEKKAERKNITSYRIKPAAAPVKNRARNDVPTITTQTRRVVVTQKIKTSNLTVSTKPGATVVLDSGDDGKPLLTKTADSNGSVIFEDLQPTGGKTSYDLKVSLPGYKTAQSPVVILPQKIIALKYDLKAITYQLELTTNLKGGEVRYAPLKSDFNQSTGRNELVETGEYCIATIGKDSKAVIKNLNNQFYNLDIRPTDLKYDTLLTQIDVEKEASQGDPDIAGVVKLDYELNLEEKVSTTNFTSAFSNDDWTLPGGWKIQDKKMTNGGTKGFALPANISYLNYIDFEMVSDVKMLDGGSIGFGFRAADKNNYYLVKISGKDASEPYFASGYLVRDGIIERLFTSPIDHLRDTVTAKKSFRVIIRGAESAFRIYLEDSNTGSPMELGVIYDTNKNLKKGAVGIVGTDSSTFEVTSFTVCNNVCK